MFEKRNISKTEAIKRSCKQNGLEYHNDVNRRPLDKIMLINESGDEKIIDKNLNIVNKKVRNIVHYTDTDSVVSNMIQEKCKSCTETDKQLCISCVSGVVKWLYENNDIDFS